MWHLGLGGFFANGGKLVQADGLRHDDAEDEAPLRVAYGNQLEVAACVDEQAHRFDRIAKFPIQGHAAGGEVEMGATSVVEDIAGEIDQEDRRGPAFLVQPVRQCGTICRKWLCVFCRLFRQGGGWG